VDEDESATAASTSATARGPAFATAGYTDRAFSSEDMSMPRGDWGPGRVINVGGGSTIQIPHLPHLRAGAVRLVVAAIAALLLLLTGY